MPKLQADMRFPSDSPSAARMVHGPALRAWDHGHEKARQSRSREGRGANGEGTGGPVSILPKQFVLCNNSPGSPVECCQPIPASGWGSRSGRMMAGPGPSAATPLPATGLAAAEVDVDVAAGESGVMIGLA